MEFLKFLNKIFSFRKKPLIVNIDDGFIPEEPTPTDWQFGSERAVMGAAVLKSNGQWTGSLPADEHQKKGTETQGCVSFSALNILEMLVRVKYGKIINKSDRFTAKMSGTGQRGNSFINVATSIRKDGAVNEEDWPFKDDLTWNTFYQTIPNGIITKGQDFLQQYKVNHEWVEFSHGKFKEALKYGPLQVGVFAWAMRNGRYYVPQGMRHQHATTLVGYKDGEYWLVYDSYGPFLKKLEWNYPFYKYAMKYHIEKIEGEDPGQQLYERFKDKFIILPFNHGEVWYVGDMFLQKVTFAISHQKLFEKIHGVLREKRVFTGVTNENFTLILDYVKNVYGADAVKEEMDEFAAEELFEKFYQL